MSRLDAGRKWFLYKKGFKHIGANCLAIYSPDLQYMLTVETNSAIKKSACFLLFLLNRKSDV